MQFVEQNVVFYSSMQALELLIITFNIVRI